MKRNITLITSLFVVAACGGSGESSSSPELGGQLTSSSVSLYAQDVTTSTKIDTLKQVNFTRNVVLSDINDDFIIVDLDNLGDQNCQASLNDDKKSVSVTSENVADCIYQYSVEAKSGKSGRSTAYLRVGVGRNYSDNTLPVVTAELNLTDQSSVQVNVIDELTASDEALTGYQLNGSLVVIGEGNAVADTQTGVIEYIANNAEPYATVYYSLQKTLETGERDIKLGTLIVSVSDSVNDEVLQARNAIYSHSVGGKYHMIGVGEEIAINVKNYLIHSDDKVLDDAQLVAVYIANGSAFSIFDNRFNPEGNLYGQYIQNDETEFSNKTLLFQASTAGTYEIVYTITDHEGNYDNGVLRLSVYNKDEMFELQGWGMIGMNICDMPSDALWGKFANIINGTGIYSALPEGPIDADDYCQLYYESEGETYSSEEKIIPTRFTPPPSAEFADYMGISYTQPFYSESNEADMALFSFPEAVQYCASMNGRLPTSGELRQLAVLNMRNKDTSLNQVGDVTDYGWPDRDKADLGYFNTYWTMDKKQSESFGREVNVIEIVTDDSGQYGRYLLNYKDAYTANDVQDYGNLSLVTCVLFDDNEGTGYGPVKPYTVNSKVIPDPEVGIKYKLESEVIDPHGDLAYQHKVTYEVFEDTGYFIDDDGNQVQVVLNFGPELFFEEDLVKDYYYDASYNKANILVKLEGAHVDTVSVNPSANLLQQMNWSGWYQVGDVTEKPGGSCYDEDGAGPLVFDYCWKRLSYIDEQGDYDRGPVDIHGVSYGLHQDDRIIKDGLPLWIKPNPKTAGTANSNVGSDQINYLGFGKTAIRNVNQYTRPYFGENFMVRVKIANLTEYTPTAGRIVFSLHQPNAPKDGIHNGNSLYNDVELAYPDNPHVNEGGKSNGYYYGSDIYDPGIMCEGIDGTPGEGRQFAFVYDYLEQTFVVRSKCGGEIMAQRSLKGLRQQYAYLWISYINGATTETGSKSANGRLKVYASANSIRPEEPLIDIDSSLGEDQVGWAKANVTVGKIGSTIEDSVTHETYDDYPYYILIATRIDYDPHSARANTAAIEELSISTWDHEQVTD